MRNIIKICKEALYKCRNVTFQGGKTCHQKNVHRISRLICTFSALLSKISVCVCVCLYVCVYTHTLVVSDSVRPFGLQPTRLVCPWDSPGKNTAVGCHALLQGIFPTQSSNPHLLSILHWQVGSLPLATPGKPKISVVSVLENFRVHEIKHF